MTSEGEKNIVIYKGSDLIYDPWNSTCGSGTSPRMKLIQVCACESGAICISLFNMTQESGGLSRMNRFRHDQIRRKKRQGIN